MGGRGSSSGIGVASGTTSEQRTVMKRFENVAKKNGYSKPVFKKQGDGSISFEYSRATTVQKVHGGRMQSADKNDIYQRTKTHHGTNGKDGLVLRGKTTANDKLIKLGKK